MPPGAVSILRRILDLIALIACHDWPSLGVVILKDQNEKMFTIYKSAMEVAHGTMQHLGAAVFYVRRRGALTCV